VTRSISAVARECLTASARARRVGSKLREIAYPKRQNRSALVAQIEQAFGAATVNPALEALAADAHGHGETFAKTVSVALKTLYDENLRLAEEIDLLWWHIGAWSEILDRALATLPQAGRPLVIGADLAAMIRVMPGPYGANGILRRALGQDADTPQSLADAVEALDFADLKRVLPAPPAGQHDILALHAAVELLIELGASGWAQSFHRGSGLRHDIRMTHYEIALQTFWERLLILHRWTR
jgi:hypothetical protein